MLKYNIRVDNSNIKKHVMSWQEKYLSPDLSLVSGTTLQSNNIYGDTTIEAANVKLGGNKNTLDMETENVTRNGFVLVKGYKFPVNSGFTYDYTTLEESGERITYNYVFINGRYYYSYNDNTFTINNFPTVNIDGVPGEYDFTISYDGSGYLKLDKVFWIEDGMVGIDGNNYYYDGDFYNEETGELGGLAYYDGGEILKHEDITNCDGIEFHKFEPKDYVGITKFLLKKRDDDVRRVENIGFVKYFYYVMYKDVMCPIRMDFNNDSFEFICEVPK